MQNGRGTAVWESMQDGRGTVVCGSHEETAKTLKFAAQVIQFCQFFDVSIFTCAQ